MAKTWTLQDKIQLFKMVEQYGTKWKDLAIMFDTTPMSVRNKYRHTDWEDFFEEHGLTEEQVMATEFDVDPIIPEVDDTESDEEESQKLEKDTRFLLDAQKNKILNDAELRKQNEYLKKIAAEEIFIEKITSAIVAMPKIDPANIKIPNINLTTRPQEVALVLSDLHVGLAVLQDEVGGFSQYNTEKFKERLGGLIDKVIRITSHHQKSCQIDTLNIFNLGDNVHGSNDAGQWGSIHTEQNIVDQVFTLISEIEKALLTLSKYF